MARTVRLLLNSLHAQTTNADTTVPEDAAKPNYIKSVPNPDQLRDKNDGLGATTLEQAADNAGNAGSGGLGEGVTGTGDALPESTTAKTFGQNSYGGKDPESAGNQGGRRGVELASKINRDEKNAVMEDEPAARGL
jgi:hypothetical protein